MKSHLTGRPSEDFPLLAQHRSLSFVVMFTGYTTGFVVQSTCADRKVGDYCTSLISIIDNGSWRTLASGESVVLRNE